MNIVHKIPAAKVTYFTESTWHVIWMFDQNFANLKINLYFSRFDNLACALILECFNVQHIIFFVFGWKFITTDILEILSKIISTQILSLFVK